MTILKTGYHVARKEHKCEWCGQSILPGEKYYYFTGSYQGDFQHTKLHMECKDPLERDCDGPDDFFEPWGNPRGKNWGDVEEEKYKEEHPNG